MSTALVARARWAPWFPGAMYRAKLMDLGATAHLAAICWLSYLCLCALQGRDPV
jgi:hypothetical protein